MRHATRRHAFLVLTLALLAAGCASAPTAPVSMRDPAANFADFKTYGWATAPTADQPLGLHDQTIRAAIATELQRRGYVESADRPDLRIAFQTASTQKIENNPVRIGLGMGSWGGNVGGSVNVGSSSVRSYQEGTLVIHAVDAARNAEVWQGSVSSKLGKGGAEPASLSQAVARAMKDFPARP
jgi:hypothetical protein